MKIFRRKPNIRNLALQLERIEQQLRAIEHDSNYLPSPIEMKALGWIRFTLPELLDYTKILEKQLRKRIITWCETPYTPVQLFRKRIMSFIGWWIAGTLMLWQSVLGWFSSLFPQQWQVIPTSAAIALLIISIITARNKIDE